MRKISLFVLLFSFIAIFSMPLSAAGPGSSTPPPKDGVCSDLKAKGITKGLFGLCVAYCEAGANSERVLENYNRKKQESDPAMPCLEVQEATLGCACWNTVSADDIGVDQDPVGCGLDPSMDYIFYQGELDIEYLSASEGACSHYNSATGADVFLPDLDWTQEKLCREEILVLAERDFSAFYCLAAPP